MASCWHYFSQGGWMELPFLLLLSAPRIAELREMPWKFSIKLQSETQVSDRLGISGRRSPRHAQNPLLGERRKTLSITHHAISPPPSHHHLYIIHLINWLQRFYRITMSLKRPFVSKSDINQWFTTTTTGHNKHISSTPLKPTVKKIASPRNHFSKKKKKKIKIVIMTWS